MNAVRALARWALVPLMRIWSAGAGVKLSDVPRPTDSPVVIVPGDDLDRILIFGGGPAVGWGVLSHALALPGSLARALSARSGRGAHVDLALNPRLTIAKARGELGSVELWHYDAIVLTIGVNDAVVLTSTRAWRRDLTTLLQFLEDNSPRTTQLFLAGIHPIRSIPVYDSFLGRAAARHAEAINRVSAHVCAGFSRATFVPLTAAPRSSPERFRTAGDFGPWAELLAERMVRVLDAGGV